MLFQRQNARRKSQSKTAKQNVRNAFTTQRLALY